MNNINTCSIYLPNEIISHILSYADEQTLGSASRVCKNWYGICHDAYFEGWKLCHARIWREPVRTTKEYPDAFAVMRARFSLLNFPFIRWNLKELGYRISSVADGILAIRHYKANKLAPMAYLVPVPGELRPQMHVLFQEWYAKIAELYFEEKKEEARYLIQEIAYTFHDANKHTELTHLRHHVFLMLLSTEMQNEERKLAYYTFKNLFISDASLIAYLSPMQEKWEFLYTSALYDFPELMQACLALNPLELQEDGIILLEAAASNKHFGILHQLLSHQPPLPCTNPHNPCDTPLHALCRLDENKMDEEEMQAWLHFTTLLMERGCSLFQVDEQNEETPLQIACKHANPAMLRHLLKSLPKDTPKDTLKALVNYFFTNLDEETADEIYDEFPKWLLTLQVILDYQPELKNEINLNNLLHFYPKMLPALLIYTDPQDKTYLNHLFKAFLIAHFTYVHNLVRDHGEHPEFLFEQLNNRFDLMREQFELFSESIDKNEQNEKQETVLHMVILSLKRIENVLEVYEIDSHSDVFQLCETHYLTLCRPLASLDNFQIQDANGKQPLDLANQFGYQKFCGFLSSLSDYKMDIDSKL
ncbi:F-box protein [Candidatus Protochlamydia phocaeensis]|uniref:F-box protein n=1 Tax=Candidatus Protochlamydia phocaeensis TaxID=1414722 RepID=UPI0008399886|nr:F-box protein [Candidatus Protochlamydia phocaeensis]